MSTAPVEYPTAPLGYVAAVIPSGVDKKSHEGETPVRLCNYTDIYYRDRITADIDFMEATANSTEIERLSLIRGDVVMTKDSETADDIGIPALVADDLDGVVLGYHNTLLRPHDGGIDSRFLFWFVTSTVAASHFETKARGVTRVGLRAEDIASLPVPTPSLEVQRRVADMLDGETARIDALIAKNQSVLAGLDARVLSHATESVCARGEGRSPSTHPSVFWIGEVPETWAVAALGLRYEVQLGKMLSAERRESGNQRPYLANVDVQWDRFNTSDLRTMDFADGEWERYGVEPGDVLICEGGEIGRAAVWPDDAPPGIHYQKALHRARPLDPIVDNPRWLYYALYVAAKTGVFQFGAESSTIDHLTGERLREHRFPFPPRSTQNDLVAEMDATLATVGALRGKVERQIDLLRSRRQALITAAVTGQIDV